MDLPLSSLVTWPSASSQREPAAEAARVVNLPAERVRLEVTDKGLLVRAITELDLEISVDAVRKMVPGARQGKPQVEYVFEPEFLEPCYVATIDAPAQNADAVISDLSTRRGVVLSTKQLPGRVQIIVDLPVSESFGYFTTLRSLTEKKGTYTLSLGGMRKGGSYDAA